MSKRLKVVLGNDPEIVKYIKGALAENNGYCPCSLIQSEENKCMCKEFKEQQTLGHCHCGLYQKIEVEA